MLLVLWVALFSLSMLHSMVREGANNRDVRYDSPGRWRRHGEALLPHRLERSRSRANKCGRVRCLRSLRWRGGSAKGPSGTALVHEGTRYSSNRSCLANSHLEGDSDPEHDYNASTLSNTHTTSSPNAQDKIAKNRQKSLEQGTWHPPVAILGFNGTFRVLNDVYIAGISPMKKDADLSVVHNDDQDDDDDDDEDDDDVLDEPACEDKGCTKDARTFLGVRNGLILTFRRGYGWMIYKSGSDAEAFAFAPCNMSSSPLLIPKGQKWILSYAYDGQWKQSTSPIDVLDASRPFLTTSSPSNSSSSSLSFNSFSSSWHGLTDLVIFGRCGINSRINDVYNYISSPHSAQERRREPSSSSSSSSSSSLSKMRSNGEERLDRRKMLFKGTKNGLYLYRGDKYKWVVGEAPFSEEKVVGVMESSGHWNIGDISGFRGDSFVKLRPAIGLFVASGIVLKGRKGSNRNINDVYLQDGEFCGESSYRGMENNLYLYALPPSSGGADEARGVHHTGKNAMNGSTPSANDDESSALWMVGPVLGDVTANAILTHLEEDHGDDNADEHLDGSGGGGGGGGPTREEKTHIGAGPSSTSSTSSSSSLRSSRRRRRSTWFVSHFLDAFEVDRDIRTSLSPHNAAESRLESVLFHFDRSTQDVSPLFLLQRNHENDEAKGQAGDGKTTLDPALHRCSSSSSSSPFTSYLYRIRRRSGINGRGARIDVSNPRPFVRFYHRMRKLFDIGISGGQFPPIPVSYVPSTNPQLGGGCSSSSGGGGGSTEGGGEGDKHNKHNRSTGMVPESVEEDMNRAGAKRRRRRGLVGEREAEQQRFLIFERLLGVGPHKVIIQARDNTSDETVAIKVFIENREYDKHISDLLWMMRDMEHAFLRKIGGGGEGEGGGGGGGFVSLDQRYGRLSSYNGWPCFVERVVPSISLAQFIEESLDILRRAVRHAAAEFPDEQSSQYPFLLFHPENLYQERLLNSSNSTTLFVRERGRRKRKENVSEQGASSPSSSFSSLLCCSSPFSALFWNWSKIVTKDIARYGPRNNTNNNNNVKCRDDSAIQENMVAGGGRILGRELDNAYGALPLEGGKEGGGGGDVIAHPLPAVSLSCWAEYILREIGFTLFQVSRTMQNLHEKHGFFAPQLLSYDVMMGGILLDAAALNVRDQSQYLLNFETTPNGILEIAAEVYQKLSVLGMLNGISNKLIEPFSLAFDMVQADSYTDENMKRLENTIMMFQIFAETR